MSLLFFSGCEETPSEEKKFENKIYIKNGDDDGYVSVLTNSLPVPFGYVTSENDQPLLVGLFTTDFLRDGNNITSRGIFRFNISGWDNTDIKFYAKCVNKQGNPGNIMVYVVNDTQPLTDFVDMRDISDIWYLMESSSGEKIEITPKKGRWIEVTISKDRINNLDIENDFIAIIVQLSNEYIKSNNDYYGFATIDYTPLDDKDLPYIIYIED